MINKKILAALILITIVGAAGGASMNVLSANAQTPTTQPTQTQQDTNRPDPTKGGHVGTNGTRETLLTGDTADKVRAAAQAAVPQATIERVETDAEGSPYEAHIKKSDGTMATVKVDSNFKVTTVEAGNMPPKTR